MNGSLIEPKPVAVLIMCVLYIVFDSLLVFFPL